MKQPGMKLLLIAPIFPPEVGGVPTLYHHICCELPPGSVTVLAADGPGAAEFDRKQPYTIHRIPRFAEIDIGGIPAIVGEALKVARLARKERATHIWIGHVNQSLLAMLLMPWVSQRIFLYAHGEEIAQDYGGRLYSLCKARFLKRLRQAVSVSRYTGELLRAKGGNGLDVAVIPNAVDTADFVPMEKDPVLLSRWGLEGKKIILTVARLEERKGHDRVIIALQRVLQKVPNAHYLVCGTGEESDRLKQMVTDMNLEDAVTFVDHVAQQELCQVYNLADLFIMPNRRVASGVTEGFGIVFLEAGACGVPVIGGNDGGVPDAIVDGETGFLVNGDDVDAIENRLVQLLSDDDLCRRMGKAGMAFAHDHSYGKLVSQLEAFLA